MCRLNLINLLTTRHLNLGRVVPEIKSEFAEKIRNKSINVKKLKTRRRQGLVRLPASLQVAAELKVRKHSDKHFRSQAKSLKQIMFHFKMPDDQYSLDEKRKDIKTQLTVRGKIDDPDLSMPEDEILAQRKLKCMIEGRVDDLKRDWHYYEYDDFSSLLYMGVRLPGNYAALKTVMDEIKAYDKDFCPESVLDFGSGMGTTVWAVDQTWPNRVHEFLNVEISKAQQELCEFLLRGGKEFGKPLHNVYHRQYLPSSLNEKYDLVVSSFTLLELPTVEMRTQVLETLWHKTKDLLVIVERGNTDGFQVINEARQLILDLSGHGVTKRLKSHPELKPKQNLAVPMSHIIAPCPHEFTCPRLDFSSKMRFNTCSFKVAHEELNIGAPRGPYCHDLFSYVVFRKGPHPNMLSGECDQRWPRVICPRNKSSGLISLKICCPDGNIGELTVTRTKYGKEVHDLAKSVDWGDVIPVQVKDSYIKNSIKRDLLQSE